MFSKPSKVIERLFHLYVPSFLAFYGWTDFFQSSVVQGGFLRNLSNFIETSGFEKF